MKKKFILLLTLKTFSDTGGIEKVNKILCRALSDESEKFNFKLFSAYDESCDERYIDKKNFAGFSTNKLWFSISSVFRSIVSDYVILTHINLAFIGSLIRLINPRCKIILFAHGIEVWRDVSSIKQLMLRNADRILAVSEHTKSELIKKHSVDGNKIVVLNNTVDPVIGLPTKFIKNEKLKESTSGGAEFIVCSIGRLSFEEQYKGYDQVIKALAALKSKGISFKYIIIGKYDVPEKNRIDILLKEFNLEKEVMLTGFVDDQSLSEFLLLADVFVMPSTEEGFGMVYLEAMYHGIPVIAGNVDGSVDALKNGELGILVNPNSVEEISKAIESVLTNKSIARGKELQEKMLKHFNYNQYKEKFINSITELA